MSGVRFPPPGSTFWLGVAQRPEHRSPKPGVVGSTPTTHAKQKIERRYNKEMLICTIPNYAENANGTT